MKKNNNDTNNTNIQTNENSDNNLYNHLLDEISDNMHNKHTFICFLLCILYIKTDIGKINYL